MYNTPVSVFRQGVFATISPDSIALADHAQADGSPEGWPPAQGDGAAERSGALTTAHTSPLHISAFDLIIPQGGSATIRNAAGDSNSIGPDSVLAVLGADSPLVAASHRSIEGDKSTIDWYPDGSLITAKKASIYRTNSGAKRVIALRGRVSGFSRQSRNRLIRTLARVKKTQIPLFVTLTYPGDFSNSPIIWKRDLDTFAKRFARKFPLGSFVWKLEPQRRGAPHFHCMVWGADLDSLRLWLPAVWYKVVGSGDEKHLRHGCDIQLIESWRGVMWYASKYMSKPVLIDDDSWGSPGRWWGIVGRQNVPFAARLSTWFYYHEVCTLMRWLRRFAKMKGRDYSSLTAIVSNPSLWVENLEKFSMQFDSRRLC